jgi:hypothetical protein
VVVVGMVAEDAVEVEEAGEVCLFNVVGIWKFSVQRVQQFERSLISRQP